jgi:NAD(P)-dependent dehydrogenase (short-subunit alcohol dehydrogenase family)
MTRSLTGKLALVTGAAKGIGAGLAKAMAAAGASVVVNFVTDRPGAERVVADIKAAGGNAVAIQDIASVGVCLASDEAGWLTGECLAVSGGLR